MKILLLGKNGQLGWELQRTLAPLGTLLALDRQGQQNYCGDLTNIEGLKKTIQTFSPDVIVNAAAYTAVDKAESDDEMAYCINAKAPALIAEEAHALGSLFIHYSTDYVFDGSGSQSWTEQNKPAPLNVYGKSKLEGEELIQKSGCSHLIFRTSWVYGIHGNNFIKTIIRLAKEREELNIIQDQIGAPTGAELLADVTAQILKDQNDVSVPIKMLSGVYHLAPQGQTSWYDYATFIIQQAKQLNAALKVTSIKPILSSQYQTAALRPLNSRLNTEKMATTFALSLPHWQDGVSRVINELLG